MLKTHTVLKSIIGHVLAGAVVILGTLAVTFFCYVIGLATAAHGIDTPMAVIPEFLFYMFAAGVFAVAVSTASFLVSVFLIWLRTKRQFPVWLPVFLVPTLTSAVIFVGSGATRDMERVALVTGLAFAYFGIYWGFLTGSAAVLDFLRARLLSKIYKKL